jgi:hypothetical protein
MTEFLESIDNTGDFVAVRGIVILDTVNILVPCKSDIVE